MLTPICVIDAKDGSRIEAGVGYWVVVSIDHVANVEQKTTLAKAYWAHAVDMESAAVARAAQAHDITFVGLKVISDEADFEMPGMERFIARDGTFRTAAFVLFVAIRPWLWGRVIRLAGNSTKAANALCEWLDQYNHDAERIGEFGARNASKPSPKQQIRAMAIAGQFALMEAGHVRHSRDHASCGLPRCERRSAGDGSGAAR